MKRTVFQKLGDFVLGKGFYIVLFLCVATIGISGYYLVRTVSTPPERRNRSPAAPPWSFPTAARMRLPPIPLPLSLHPPRLL